MQTTIKGHVYSIGKMDAFKQFHVARRLAPLLFATSTGLLARLRGGEMAGDDFASMVSAAEPMIQVISSMNDTDSQYILDSCLAVCQRRQDTGFQRVQTDTGQFLFADIDLPVVLQLVAAVLKDNLGNFFDALPDQPAEPTSK